MRESQNRYEELISLCSDYEKEFENQDFFPEDSATEMLQRHQFGAISFYTSSQNSINHPQQWSHGTAHQPNR